MPRVFIVTTFFVSKSPQSSVSCCFFYEFVDAGLDYACVDLTEAKADLAGYAVVCAVLVDDCIDAGYCLTPGGVHLSFAFGCNYLVLGSSTSSNPQSSNPSSFHPAGLAFANGLGNSFRSESDLDAETSSSN